MINSAIIVLIIAVLSGLTACDEISTGTVSTPIPGGDPEKGRRLIQVYGCGTCHTMDAVEGARGKVGPPLDDYAQRHLLAGILPNVPHYLIRWIMNPVSLDPRTGMPSLGVREDEARHIASYLYTLGASGAQVWPPDPPLALPTADQLPAAAEVATRPAPVSEFEPRTRRIAPVPGAARS